MNAFSRNQSRFFSIDMESADANLLAQILKEQAVELAGAGRADVHRRLSDYGEQIKRYALPGADLFCPADFADACIQMGRARSWRVGHEPRQWDKRGNVLIELDYGVGDTQCWLSRDWRVPPDAPQIDELRRSLRQIVPATCQEQR